MAREETLPSRNERVVARRSGETVFLLDPISGEYFTLDDVGGRIWELCDGTRTPGDIAEVLAAEYDAPTEKILHDVIALLDDLARSELVVR